MNKLLSETESFVSQLREELTPESKDYVVLLIPMATHLTKLVSLTNKSNILVGAQNSGVNRFGAFTGEISPAVLKEIGVGWTLIGHSERRHIFHEEDTQILSRVQAAMTEGLQVILCVGETLQDRKSGKTASIIESQLSILQQNHFDGTKLSQLVVAYEPVWAIGTGETATPEQAQEVQRDIRAWFREKFGNATAETLTILYGGSVKPENAEALMNQPDVDGFLVGGASLDPRTFANLIKNGLKSQSTRRGKE